MEQPTNRTPRCCRPSLFRLFGAFLCLAGMIATWTVQAEVLQDLNRRYKQPYFLTFWGHSYFSLMYVVWKIWRIFPGNLSCNQVGDGAFTKARPHLIISGVLAVLHLLAGYVWTLSLTRTNIPANTAIYQSIPAVVFVLSVPILKERVTVLKVLSVSLCIGGVPLVAFYSFHDQCASDNHGNISTLLMSSSSESSCKERSTALGYVYVGCSILGHSIANVLYKKYATRQEDPAVLPNATRYVGYIGVHTLFWLWPPIIILHYSRVEVFELPAEDLLGLLFLSAVLTTLYQSLCLLCVALTSPLFTNVGSVLVVPATVIVDWILQGYILPPLAYVGIVLIVVGFGGFVLSELVAIKRDGKQHSMLETVIQASDNENSPLIENSRNFKWRYVRFLI